MRWRLFKLDWRYGIGELCIVTLGVLVALAIDQWNSDRLDRAEELVIIEQLVSDLENDLDGIDLGLSILLQKVESLGRVNSTLTNTALRPEDSRKFLTDIINGSLYGWNQHDARRTTFDELLGSGRFILIQDAALRLKISDYYDLDFISANRIDERETQYPHISYQLVPRGTESELARGLNDDDLERLVDAVLESPLREHVVAEINFARFVADMFMALKTECLDLIDVLETYRSKIA